MDRHVIAAFAGVIAASLALTAEAPYAQEGPGCELRGQVSSAGAEQPASFTFTNTGATEYYVYWIDGNGRESDGQGGQLPLLRVEPGASGTIDTFVGHYLSVFDGQQRCLGVFQADGTAMAVRLAGQAGSEPAVTAQQQTAAAAATGTSEALSQVALSTHNALRALHCVPPLQWSARLAAIAQQWADRCVFEHSQSGLGENLAIGTSGAFPAETQIQSWYDEIARYDFANARFTSGTGHFTQVVWRSTTEVGCGVASCNGEDLLVCNYAPPGNFQGEYDQNVPQRCQ
jgi:uncharacterized protein YkwD